MAHVLAVDDDRDVLDIIGVMLRTGGHQVVLSGPDATLEARLAAGAYDLVITDLNMPGMPGAAIADAVSRHRPGTPVVAITGDGGDLAGEDDNARFAALLPKPFRREALLRLVTRLLGERR
jgi:DNA-binding NtrC family response regulator